MAAMTKPATITAERHAAKMNACPRDEPEDEQQHERADAVARQNASDRREPEDDEGVDGGQHGNGDVLSIERVRAAANRKVAQFTNAMA